MLRTRLSSFVMISLVAAALASASRAHADDDDAPPPRRPGGGFKIGAEHPPCDGKHDHCLRPQARFRLWGSDDFAKKAGSATVVFAARGRWWTWDDNDVKSWTDGPVVRTAPATAKNVKVGDVVVIWDDGPEDQAGNPQSETATHTNVWLVTTVHEIDASAGTITTKNTVWPMAKVRVVVAKETSPPPP